MCLQDRPMMPSIVKLLLIILLPIALILGFILIVPQVLSIDDLASCSAPQMLDAKCASADVIVAISGGDTQARANEAIKLYQQGWAPMIIFSGAAQDKQNSSNAAVMRQMALSARVPSDAILLDEASASTADNASLVRPIVQQRGFKRLILVTSPYHQRRASIEFNRRLGDLCTIVNHPTSTDRFWSASHWWATPWGLWLAGSETLKVMFTSVSNG
jgi:uncharacterized SAM-binding protein YcdF (DUF218 family)